VLSADFPPQDLQVRGDLQPEGVTGRDLAGDATCTAASDSSRAAKVGGRAREALCSRAGLAPWQPWGCPRRYCGKAAPTKESACRVLHTVPRIHALRQTTSSLPSPRAAAVTPRPGDPDAFSVVPRAT
jgi:hypothetical protein